MPGGGGRAASATRQRRLRAKEQYDREYEEKRARSYSPGILRRSESADSNENELERKAEMTRRKRTTGVTEDGNETDQSNDMSPRLPGVEAYLQGARTSSGAEKEQMFLDRNKQAYNGDADEDGGAQRKQPLEEATAMENVNYFREFCGMIVNNSRVQLGIIVLIVINAILMGLATFSFVEDDPDAQQTFHVLDKIFLIIFTIEISLQLIYLGPIKLLMDPWLVFDAFVVITSWSLESLQIVRAFRIFRAFRLIARLTILRNLANAIFRVLPNMAAISALLTLVLYIYSVLCTVLFHDLYERGLTEEDYFSRLDITFLTLLEIMTLGWAEIVRQVQVVYWWAWMPFVSFILISAFIVYNLVVAVVCDAVTVVEQESKKEEFEKDQELRLQRQQSRDSDGDFRPPLTLREQQERQLNSLQLKVSQLIETQKTILQSVEATMLELESYNNGPSASSGEAT